MDATVLDLFAGTGALGIEALSRGAAHCTFVEKSTSVAKLMQWNIESCGFGSRSSVMRLDSLKALERLAAKHENFDLVFMDPPYGEGLEMKAALKALDLDLLAGNFTLVVESFAGDGFFEKQLDGLFVVERHRIYGDTALWLFAGRHVERSE